MLQKLEFTAKDNELLNSGAIIMTEKDGYTLVNTVPEHEFWKNIHGEVLDSMCVFFAKELEPGIYQTKLNFHMGMRQYTDFSPISSHERLGKDGLPKKYEQDSSIMDYFENTIESYGIADNVEQIKQYYQDQINSDAKIVINLTEIRKDNQPENGGWRWEKWGKYIGTRESKADYIYDEPEIDSVYVFHVYSVKPKKELEYEKEVAKKMKM